MPDAKPWYLSKTIWAAIVAIGANAGAALGFPIDPSQTGELSEAILQLVAALAGVTAIFGRLTATNRIKWQN